jgi:serine/threonine protein kinase
MLAFISDLTKSSRRWALAAWARSTGRRTRLGRDVVLKVLPADLAGDTTRRARFEQEARVLTELNHHDIPSDYPRRP